MDELDKNKVQLNTKAIYFLHCVLYINEYNRVCRCELAKDTWRLLEVTNEGTNQVKESRINTLVHRYELFAIF